MEPAKIDHVRKREFDRIFVRAKRLESPRGASTAAVILAEGAAAGQLAKYPITPLDLQREFHRARQNTPTHSIPHLPLPNTARPHP